jgi:hypothetical protein
MSRIQRHQKINPPGQVGTFIEKLAHGGVHFQQGRAARGFSAENAKRGRLGGS